MSRGRFGLILRLALLVVATEILAFGSLGWFYVHKFTAAAEASLYARLHLVGKMVASEELEITALSREAVISNLIGAPYITGLVVGSSGRVIVSTDDTLLGQPIETVAGVDKSWFTTTAKDEQFILRDDILTCILHIHNPENNDTIYYLIMKVSKAEMSEQQRQVALFGFFGSLIFILLSSALIILLSHRLITKRIDVTLSVLHQVEGGELGSRIPVLYDDELSILQYSINSMTDKLGRLLRESYSTSVILQQQKDLLQSVIEHAPIRVFWKDKDSRYLGCNRLFANDAGIFVTENIVGKTDFDMSWKAQADIFRADDAEVIGTNKPKLGFEEELTNSIDHTIAIRTSKVPLHDETNSVIGVLGIYEDITERKLVQDQLIKAKERAEAANAAKGQFLANMSHELRTPLNAVMGFSDILLISETDPERREYLEIVRDSGKSLLSIINDILDLSKIDAGRIVTASEAFSPKDLITGTTAMFKSLALNNNIQLAVTTDHTVPSVVLGDAGLLRQVLTNLIGNAVKFTKHGSITVALTCTQVDADVATILFKVTDTGIGIRQENLARIFEMFEQEDSSHTRRFGGTGLGLTITKKLVDIMNGRISVESEPGKGSIFWFTVPLPVVFDTTQTLLLPIAAHATTIKRALRILVAEDNPINQRLISTMLQKLGHTVLVVDDGHKALEMVSSEDVDVVLMDMLMPVMSGEEATKAIRLLPYPRNQVPIIAVTADAMVEHRDRYREAGVNDLVLKPIDWPILSDMITKYALQSSIIG